MDPSAGALQLLESAGGDGETLIAYHDCITHRAETWTPHKQDEWNL